MDPTVARVVEVGRERAGSEDSFIRMVVLSDGKARGEVWSPVDKVWVPEPGMLAGRFTDAFRVSPAELEARGIPL